jgi:ATP synthase protein I
MTAQYGPRGFFGTARSSDLPDLPGVEGMSNDTGGNGSRRPGPTDEAKLSARLRRLGERLDKTARGRSRETESAARPNADMSGFARGMRLSAELVGGVVVGFLLGWLLDRWLGTTPWGLIVFLLLGFAAGTLNVMRAAGVVKQGPESGGGWR